MKALTPTDAKQIVVPRSTPAIGGLRWAYYSGNSVAIKTNHVAKPRALVPNDTSVPPLNGNRNAPGALLAAAERGGGRVVVVTDSGWITDAALKGEGIGGVAMKDQDNWEIIRRLALWTGHLN